MTGGAQPEGRTLAQVARDTGLRCSGSLLVELRCFWMCSCSYPSPAFPVSYSLASSFICPSAVVFHYCFVLSLLSDIVSQFCLCCSSLRALRFKHITCKQNGMRLCTAYAVCCLDTRLRRMLSFRKMCQAVQLKEILLLLLLG